jgi:CubicO group peptidase (beta-lactamase class C family)
MWLLFAWACASKTETAAPAETAAPTETGPATESETETTDTDSETEPSYDARYDALIPLMEAELAAYGAPGGSITIAQDGVVVWARGFGTTERGGSVPVSPDTLFRIGSTTKAMTAVTFLQQVEAGRTSLDAPVTDAVPYFTFVNDASWAPTMLGRHLLTHQTSVYDYGELDFYWDDGLLRAAFDVGGVLPTYLWLMASSGAFWNYANPNFALAGLAAEELDGRYWREIVVDDVLEPLGMDRSFVRSEEVLADGDYAVGYGPDVVTGTTWVDLQPDDYELVSLGPAGTVWSSTNQMVAWGQFLAEGGAPLGDALRAEMSAPAVDTLYLPGGAVSYGYGLFVDAGFWDASGVWRSGRLIEHGGDINGYASNLYVLPDDGWVISVLVSASYAHPTATIAEAMVLSGHFGTGGEPDLTIDPAAVAQVAGRYIDPWNVGEILLTVKDGVVQVEAPLLDEYGVYYGRTMTEYTPDNFLWEVDTLTDLVTFVRDEGVPTYLRSRYYVATRDDAALTSSASADPSRLPRIRPTVGPLPIAMRTVPAR